MGVGATAKVTGWLPRGLPCGKYPQHCDHKRETERGRERQELEGGADRLRALGFGRAPALHRWFPPGSWDHPGLRLHSHLPWRNSGVCVFLSKLKDPEAVQALPHSGQPRATWASALARRRLLAWGITTQSKGQGRRTGRVPPHRRLLKEHTPGWVLRAETPLFLK